MARILAVWTATVSMLACSRPSPSEDAASALDGAMPTLDALGGHVLVSLARQDTTALNAVRLTETEHNQIV
ncbi:MAG: hypothetical protein R3246_16825, partial [Acidimicrobiia bacterium]|nr:hypothetical protein [Acidimicrobiia bacterium]